MLELKGKKWTVEEKPTASAVMMVIRNPWRLTRKLAQRVAKCTKANAGKRKVPMADNLSIISKSLHQTKDGKAIEIFCNGDRFGFQF